jgi:hypothetical protein
VTGLNNNNFIEESGAEEFHKIKNKRSGIHKCDLRNI